MLGRRTWLRRAAAGLILLLLLFSAIAGRSSLRHDAYWIYVEQIVTGNWSSDQKELPEGIGDYVYVLGFIAAVVVNFGPLIAILGTLLALVRRKADMNLVNAFASHDFTIEATIVRNLQAETFIPEEHRSEIARKIRMWFEEGRADWFGSFLNERFGPDEAERIRQSMKDTHFGS